MWYVILNTEEKVFWVDPISATSPKNNMGSYWDEDVKKAYKFETPFGAETAIAGHGLTGVTVVRIY
jgi:hypothetical protein